MRKYQLKILAWVFSAFIDNEDESDKPEDDYYALLGIRKNATTDEIRRAYKKKSLQLHPDKIAQRAAAGDKTPEEIRRDFQKIKEAYECLSDPQQREIYDGLGSLGTKFINNPQAAMDPHTLLENLAKSSFCDRTKLFTVVLLLTLMVLMQPILICAKIDQDLKGVGVLAASSWAAVLTPLWFLDALFLFLFTSAKVVGITIKFLCIIALQIFLVLKWDETVSWSYAIVLIPLYLLEVARIGSCLYWIRKMNSEMLRMVTIEYLEEVIIPKHYSGKNKAGDGEDEEEEKDEELGDETTEKRLYADLTEEERDEINHIYRIVHLPPDVTQAVDAGIEMDHDEQIAQSSEYQAAIEMQWQAVRAIRNIIIIHLPTIVLLVLKADYIKDYSWWTVSVPLWVQIGLIMGKSCFTCCTAGAEVSSEDEEMLAATMMAQAAENKNNSKDDNNKEAEDQRDEPLAPPGNVSSSDAGEETDAGDKVRAMAGSATAKKDVADEEKFSEEETKSSQDIDVEDLKSMKISQLKAELDAYGISTSSFIEKSEYVSALAEAKASGRPKTKVVQTTTTPSPAKKEESKKADDDSDASSGVYIDEETFRAWAAAQEAHEAKASEIAAKACARCCEQVFYAVMLALFVGKLAGEDVGGDPAGINSFSSFWILFPFLLVAGIFLCCCCCSIYCASGMEGMEENLRQSMSTKKPADAGGDGAGPAEAGPTKTDEEAPPAPFIPVPPPAPLGEETKEEEQKTKVAEMMLAEAVKVSKEQDVEPQSDSDGLD